MNHGTAANHPLTVTRAGPPSEPEADPCKQRQFPYALWFTAVCTGAFLVFGWVRYLSTRSDSTDVCFFNPILANVVVFVIVFLWVVGLVLLCNTYEHRSVKDNSVCYRLSVAILVFVIVQSCVFAVVVYFVNDKRGRDWREDHEHNPYSWAIFWGILFAIVTCVSCSSLWGASVCYARPQQQDAATWAAQPEEPGSATTGAQGTPQGPSIC